QSVADRLVRQRLLLVPPRGVPVQAPGMLEVLLQPGPEEVGEQVVVAPPAPDVVELHHEQTGPVHLFKELLTVIAAGDRVTQRLAETVQDRRLEEEVPQVLSLAAEDLLGQVVKDVPVAAGEGGHETAHVGLGTQRQRRQLQADGPAFGAFGQRGRHRERGGGQALAAAEGSSSVRPWRSRAAASSRLNLRSAARTSPSSPRPRYRARPRGGSERLASTTRNRGGRGPGKNTTDGL